MEEFAREELYRIKLVLKHKRKAIEKKKHTEPSNFCPICAKKPGFTLEIPPEEEIEIRKPKLTLEPAIKEPKVIEIKSEFQPKRKQIEYIPTPRNERSRTDREVLLQQGERSVDPLHFLSLGESNINIKLEYLKNQLTDVVILSKNFVDKGYIDIREFLTSCNNVRHKIEEYFNNQEPRRELDERMKSQLDHLKCHLREVIDVTREFRDKTLLSPSVENFVQTCEAVEKKLHIYFRNVDSKPISETAKQRLEELKSHIQDVIQLTKDYEKDGLLTPSVEVFLKSCAMAAKKIDYYTKETINMDKEKLEHLKDHITDMEEIATDVKQEGLASTSLEFFLSSCKDFKAKLEQYKIRGRKPPTEGSLTKLMNQIDETIELSREAKEGGLMTESVEEFIKSCEEIKKRIESRQDKDAMPKSPNVLGELKENIDDVMKLISQCRTDGLITSSVAEFLKSCEETKSKIEIYERYPLDDYEGIMIYPKCSDTCICGERDSVSSEPCERCEEIMKDDDDDNKSLPPPPCDFCAGIIREPESEESICDTCSGKPLVELPEWPAYVSPEQSEELICSFCKKPVEEKESKIIQLEPPKEEEVEKETKPSPVDSSLGYFEKKVRKITRIKRFQNRDGTIREEKETILIRKEKHDPNETTLVDNEDDEFGDVSYESMLEDDKNVGLCIAPEQNQRGFLNIVRQIKSAVNKKQLPLFDPILIHSISLDALKSRTKSNEAGCSKDTRKRAVLDRIIIPRITATLAYIKSELEENEREETFRLKRFKELKYKHSKKDDLHICCCCLSMFESQEDTSTSVCPVCQKAAKAKKTTSELKVNVIPCKCAVMTTKENVKRLEHLLSHIDEVIDLTKQYKTEGILSPSMEKFIKTCNLAKEKIEDFANAPPLCDVCGKALEHAGSRVNLAHSISNTASFKSVELPPCKTCDQPSEGTDNTFEISPDTDDKLGYFEKKFKEIIKVTRLKNDDGSVSEEKQVITIRTERRNPRKTAMDFNNQPIIPVSGFGGGGFGGGGKRGERPCSDNKDINGGNNSNRSRNFGGDGGSDYCSIKPRETKSEHINYSHQMGEPKLRPCMSALNPKPSTNRDASTNFNSDSFSSIKNFRVTLPSESSRSLKKPCSALPKMDLTSSIDSQMCCPKKMPSACGREHQSGKSSQVSVSSCRAMTTNSSAQTCCKEIPVKKPMVDKGTCCLPVCGGDLKCLDDKNSKSKSIATDALWRDAWTSTTDLTAIPSKLPSKKTSPEPSNVFDCANKDSNEGTGKKGMTVSNSCCTIKLIAKPPKVCAFEKAENKAPKEEQTEIVLSGSMLDAIKKIFIGPSRSVESCKVDTAVPKTPEIKNICKSCLSKLNSEAASKSSSVVPPVPSTKSSNISSTCKMCQAKVDEPIESEVNSCASCGTIAKSSSASLSCKSMAIGSPTSSITNISQHTCSKPATPSLHSEKHSCCLSKKSSSKSSSDDDDDNTCCAMVQTTSPKSVCCSKSKTESVRCPSTKGSNTSQQLDKTQASCSEKKDAGTSTKRSAKYDVRPLRRQPNNARLNLNSCVCKSDPRLNRGRHHRPNQCKSFHEDDYYYFRW